MIRPIVAILVTVLMFGVVIGDQQLKKHDARLADLYYGAGAEYERIRTIKWLTEDFKGRWAKFEKVEDTLSIRWTSVKDPQLDREAQVKGMGFSALSGTTYSPVMLMRDWS